MHQSSKRGANAFFPQSASARSGRPADDDVLFDTADNRGRRTPSPPPASALTFPSPSAPKSGRAAGSSAISPFTLSSSTARTKRAGATTKMATTTTTTTMKEFMPRTWQATAAAYSTTQCAAPPQVVMDPVALLRHCIRYFSSHPETYGTDIQGLLEQEALHVMRLKASEMALVGAAPVMFGTTGVADTTAALSSTRTQAGGFLPPLRDRPAAASLGATYPKRLRGGAATADGAGDNSETDATFGYGGISFIEPTPGFLALLEGATTTREAAAALRDASLGALGAGPHGPSSVGASGFPAESIGWEGTLTTQDITAYRDRRGTQPQDSTTSGEQGPGDANVLELVSGAVDADGELSGALPRSSELFARPLSAPSDGPGVSRRYGDSMRAAAPAPAPIIVDGAGYETSFLRSQLQQLEAAYNAKSIRMHEMLEENASLVSRLRLAETSAESRLSAYNTLQTQLDMLKRELDGWKDKANDASQQATAQANKQSQQSRKAASTQLTEAKQETAKLAELWRETERACQESRRALENSEKEANHTHDHLSDAFHYIERLERRVARRNQYIDLCLRRQQSMEEKYEKLMWCLRELGTMSGVYSYADALLASDPLWTLVLFTRVQRHSGDFSPAPQLTTSSSSSSSLAGATRGSDAGVVLRHLTFAQTPTGGVLVDDAFDVQTVYKMIADTVTAADERRGGMRRLRTNLHGTVACRAARALLPNAVDYLGGEDNLPEGSDVNKRKLPVLTLASLVLSCGPNTASAGSGSGAARASTAAPGSPLSETLQHGGFHPDVTTTVPNSKQFDQLTLRFLLRQFWKERLAQYMQTMTERKAAAVAEAQKQAQRSAASPSRGAGATPSTTRPGAAEEAEEEPSRNTFLAALVCFVNRITTGSADGPGTSAAPTAEDAAGMSGVLAEDPLLALRLAFARKDEEAGLIDNGRVAFATVDSARVRYPQAASSPAAAAPTNTTTTTTDPALTPGQARMKRLLMLSGTTSRVEVAPKAHELLCAFYYYALEYKDSDADFRLFYLISHQLIPEMVGVNFYANLEAVEKALRTALDQHVLQSEQEAAAAHAPTPAEASLPEATDVPLDALVKVVRLVDTAPLVGEDVEFDVDSDGEGYGSILPGARGDQTSAHLPLKSVSARPSVADSSRRTRSVADSRDSAAPGRRGRSLVRINSEVGGGGGGDVGEGQDGALTAVPTAKDDAELRHNLRDYLATLPHRRNDADFSPLFQEEGLTENVYETSWPAGWEALNDRVNTALAPHEALLGSFKKVLATGDPASLGLRYQRERRESYRLYQSSHLCAARGLLPVADVLRVLQAHAFGTYAVTCCGAPRYSLADTLFDSDAASGNGSVDPLDLVGQVPITEWQLQRLRFALALDQPSSLVRPSQLFDIDPHTSTPTHFYDEYLTLTLDLALRQQTLLIDQLLGACAARHDRYLDEGAEECDGAIPVSFLKTGFTTLFRSLGLGKEEAYAMVEHLVFYDSLLRLEDEVKLEQFTDAPFMINTTLQQADAQANATGTTPMAPPSDPAHSPPKAAPAASPRKGVADEAETWDVHDEMETCSLLHLILALRMTYVVWGTNARPFATTVSRLAGSIAIDAELESTQEAKRRSSKLNGHTRATAGATAAVSSRRGVWSDDVVGRLTEREEVMESFQASTKVQYVEAAARASSGRQGLRNPLRQTQQRLNAQWEAAVFSRAADGDGATNTSDGKSSASGTRRSLKPFGGKPGRDSTDGGESPTTSEALLNSPFAAARLRPVSPSVLDRYSVKTSLLPLGVYPDLSRLLPTSAERPTTASDAADGSRSHSGAQGGRSNTKKGKTASKKSGSVAMGERSTRTSSAADHAEALGLGALNTSVLSLARVLGLLTTTTNPDLYAATNDALAPAAQGKKAKASKKKAKAAKPGTADMLETLCRLTTLGARDTLHERQMQQVALLAAVTEQVQALRTDATVARISDAQAPASKTARAESAAPSARGGKRAVRAVAFTEPAGAENALSETEAAVQTFKDRRVQMDWAPSFGRPEANPEDTADSTGTDNTRDGRVLDVELLLQACAALSL